MKRLKILPGAAGVIALTATLGFVDGDRKDVDDERVSKGKIALVVPIKHFSTNKNISSNSPDINSDKPIYLVEIRRGNKVEEVKIDATSGEILS